MPNRVTLALSQLIYFIYLQAPFTHGEDGIQGIPQGHLFGFINLANPTILYYVILAGFLLRPGFGVPGDDRRIDSLWRLQETGPGSPAKRIKTQEYLLWRRVAGGLSPTRLPLHDAVVPPVGPLRRLIGLPILPPPSPL